MRPLAACLLLSAGILGHPATGWSRKPPSPPPVATTQAVERLMRATRQNLVRPDPLIPAEGPLDPVPELSTQDELEQAILCIQDQDYAGAIPLLEAALKDQPTTEAIWEALGWCYHNIGQTDEAEALWLRYLNLRPDSPKAHSLLAQMAVLRNDWRAADRYLQNSLRLDPDNYDVRFWYAQNQFRLGRLDEATTAMEQLVAEDDSRLDVQVDLARMLTLLQRYEEALELWENINREIPAHPTFQAEYARALMFAGELEEARQLAQAIIQDRPEDWETILLLADLAELTQRPEDMVQALEDLIHATHNEENRGKLHARLAARLVTLHAREPTRWRLEPALEHYAAAIETAPQNVPWRNQYAQVAVMAGQSHLARTTANQILNEFNPNNEQALRTLFEVEMLARNYPVAEQILHELYERLQTQDPYRHLEQARLEIARGRYQQAMDSLDRLEEIGGRGAVFTLLYHGLTESEWVALTSTRRLQEHLRALQKAGFTFIAPLDIPAYLQSRDQPREQPAPKPWLAQTVNHVYYAFTGKRRTPPPAEDLRPEKVAVVTFDDGLRSSFRLGADVAHDLGVPFGMFIITSIDELNAPIYAAWEEIQAAQESGAWQIGSHLMYANTPMPIGPEEQPLVMPLVNRIWRPERNRLESLREWTARVRREFVESRQRIEERLELAPNTPMAIAYPFDEIGTEESSNVALLLNPIQTILDQASRSYELGFSVGRFGYTTPDNNLYRVQRYEPAWNQSAEELVEQALANHPLMIARRLRAEIATLMNRPYLAEKQVELLRRDGYPERLLHQLIAETQNRLPTAAAVGGPGEVERGTLRRTQLRPSNLYLAATYNENQFSDSILQRYGEVRGGMNLNPLTGIEVAYHQGDIEQTVNSNIWYTVRVHDSITTQETRRDTVDGQTTVSSSTVTTSTTRDVQTNRVETYNYDADIEGIRALLTLRINYAASLYGSLGRKTLKLKSSPHQEARTYNEVIGSLVLSWRPYHAIQLLALYDHDLVISARSKIAYDAFGLDAFWKVNDNWDLHGKAHYWNFADDNAMIHLLASSLWQIFPRQGIWAGAETSIHSMDKDSDLYWSPYWDRRANAVLRLRRSYLDYSFQFDTRFGIQSEKARAKDRDLYRNLRAQAAADGNWHPGANPETGWDPFIGLSLTYRQLLWRHLNLIGDLSVDFLREYSEHNVSIGLQLVF
jgi:tetratricopeptide (TPR) repeat protein